MEEKNENMKEEQHTIHYDTPSPDNIRGNKKGKKEYALIRQCHESCRLRNYVLNSKTKIILIKSDLLSERIYIFHQLWLNKKFKFKISIINHV